MRLAQQYQPRSPGSRAARGDVTRHGSRPQTISRQNNLENQNEREHNLSGLPSVTLVIFSIQPVTEMQQCYAASCLVFMMMDVRNYLAVAIRVRKSV
jgi:hypothetical protein